MFYFCVRTDGGECGGYILYRKLSVAADKLQSNPNIWPASGCIYAQCRLQHKRIFRIFFDTPKYNDGKNAGTAAHGATAISAAFVRGGNLNFACWQERFLGGWWHFA